MKKIIFIIALTFGLFLQAKAAVTITKTASNSNPYIGEIFEYTINIQGITSMAQLGKIEDVLNPNLQYISSDFATSSNIAGLYNVFCTGGGALTAPSPGSSGTLVFNFPAGCSGSGGGNLSFKIKVAVKTSACSLNIVSIGNSVKLLNQTNSLVATSSITAITVNKANPWKLIKTFRSFAAGFLIYDVRLVSSVAEYYTNVLPSTAFTDNFTGSSCIDYDGVNSQVVYVPNEANLNVTQPMTSAATHPNGLVFNWSLPAVGGSNFPSSYLFLVKIKVLGCSCEDSNFDLLNKAEFNGTDVCGNNIYLVDNFNLLSATCANGSGGSGPIVTAPEQPEICVSKHVVLDNNQLNLTMAGCTGKYIIKVKNCTESFNYTIIKLSDIFPSSANLTVNCAGISVAPFTYTSALTTTVGCAGLNFYSTIALAPGQEIIIEVPFTVVTNVPNQSIQNCAMAEITLENGIIPPFAMTKTACDVGITTVPNEVAVLVSKKICSSSIHTCGVYTNANNLPGDEVEYALHFYNYGTRDGTALRLTDQIPVFFNIQNLNTDVRVYKLTNAAGLLNNTCDISTLVDITSTVTKTFIGNKLVVNFSSNILDKFTCAGVTHYVVKIKTKIANNAPNGNYPNSFTLDYKDLGVPKLFVSNTVNSVVQKDQFVITKKEVSSKTTDCVNKRNTIDYEIWAVNMGYIPITLKINDIVSIPAPLAIANGISNVQYLIAPSTTWLPLSSGSGMTVTTTTTTLNINNYTLAPCELVKFKYRIIINTSGLNSGQTKEVCNKAKITVGYMSKLILDYTDASLPNITLVKNVDLINQYFDASSDAVKFTILEKMKSERKAPALEEKRKTFPKLDIALPLVYVPIDTLSIDPVCIKISDCLNGASRGCLSSNGGNNFTFSVVNLQPNKTLLTNLQIFAGAPKVRKVEYILSDIRMITNGCIVCCLPNTTGNFFCTDLTPIGGLSHNYLITYPPGIYREKNKVEFVSSGYNNIAGNHAKSFQLPIANWSCSGDVELVITAIIYFEDCSICYQSVAFDYRTKPTWRPILLPWTLPNPKSALDNNPTVYEGGNPAKADINRSRSNIKQQIDGKPVTNDSTTKPILNKKTSDSLGFILEKGLFRTKEVKESMEILKSSNCSLDLNSRKIYPIDQSNYEISYEIIDRENNFDAKEMVILVNDKMPFVFFDNFKDSGNANNLKIFGCKWSDWVDTEGSYTSVCACSKVVLCKTRRLCFRKKNGMFVKQTRWKVCNGKNKTQDRWKFWYCGC